MRFLLSHFIMSVSPKIHDVLAKAKRCLYTDRGLWFLIGLFFGLVAMTAIIESWMDKSTTSGETTLESATTPDTVLAFASSTPLRLRIPAIDLETEFSDALGLTPEAELEVPESYTSVGWYKYGPTPGAVGPAVVVGHVDSFEGPAVFFSLGALEPGDEIFVDRVDGTTARFVVTALERPAQSAFPTESVYGDIDHAGLRLITCTGTYVRGVNRYTHNLIVYARLVT